MSKTFCPLPWIFQAVRNNGDYRICCQANVAPDRGILRTAEGRVANAGQDDSETARNLPLMANARRMMLEGKWPESCVRCANEEAAGLRSRRIYENQLWGDTVTAESVQPFTQADGQLDIAKVPLRTVDLRFGNKCNLKCRMCGPTDSDFWYDDHVELFGRYFDETNGLVTLEQDSEGHWKTIKGEYDWYEAGVEFWKSIAAALPGLRHLHIVGGEPLLLAKHYELIGNIVRAGHASHITLEYNSNLTVLPQKVLDLWAQFERVKVGVSVDGPGRLNEYIRFPSKWNVVEANLHRLDQAPGKIEAWISPTVQVYNVFYLPEMIDWRLAAGFKRLNAQARAPLLTCHPLHSPPRANIRILPQSVKRKVEEKFARYIERFALRVRSGEFADRLNGDILLPRLEDLLSGYVKFMNAEDMSSFFPEFLQFTENLDRMRGQSFAMAAPEWSAILVGETAPPPFATL